MNMNPSEIESEYLNGVYNEIANALGIEVAMTLYSTSVSYTHLKAPAQPRMKARVRHHRRSNIPFRRPPPNTAYRAYCMEQARHRSRE